jgi:hypothetical protein
MSETPASPSASSDELPFIWSSQNPISALWSDALYDPDFVDANSLEPDITLDEEKEARAIIFKTPSAPLKPSTPGAAIAMRRLLQRYDFSTENESSRLRTYAIVRLLELAESDKENIALGALEKIGKIAEVGLFETKISVSVSQKPTEELEKDLQSILARYITEKTVSEVPAHEPISS